MMEFSCPTMTGTLPLPRSWHAATVMPRQRIFVHGGYDGNQILTDSFVFELGELSSTWKFLTKRGQKFMILSAKASSSLLYHGVLDHYNYYGLHHISHSFFTKC